MTVNIIKSGIYSTSLPLYSFWYLWRFYVTAEPSFVAYVRGQEQWADEINAQIVETA